MKLVMFSRHTRAPAHDTMRCMRKPHSSMLTGCCTSKFTTVRRVRLDRVLVADGVHGRRAAQDDGQQGPMRIGLDVQEDAGAGVTRADDLAVENPVLHLFLSLHGASTMVLIR